MSQSEMDVKIFFNITTFDKLLWHFWYLNISADECFSPAVPPFVEGGGELLDYFVILHSPLELDCSATGTPSPTIM